MKRLFEKFYLKDGHQSSFLVLKIFWDIKIDFITFLDFLDKYHLLQLLDKLNEDREEEVDDHTKKQLFQGSDLLLCHVKSQFSKDYHSDCDPLSNVITVL